MHPNVLAISAVLLAIISFELNANKRLSGQNLAITLILVLAVLALTQSRTSILALIITMIFLYLSRGKERIILTVPVVSFFGFLASLVMIFPETMAAFTRSGDVSELVTLTGRTVVWDYSWKLIDKSPLLGYGYGSTWYIFNEAANFLSLYTHGYIFPHSHNLYIQLMLNGGYPALALFFVFIFVSLRACILYKSPFSFALIIMYISFSFSEAGGFFMYYDFYLMPLGLAIAELGYRQAFARKLKASSRRRLIRVNPAKTHRRIARA
nr:O-antigen ligase family protein [Erythrobacter sp. A6_0]